MAGTVRVKDEGAQRELRAKTVGRFFQSARRKAGLTQREMAQRLSYSTPQFVSNWERGVCLPPLEALPRVASVCRVSPTRIVDVLYQYEKEALKMQKKRLITVLNRKKAGSVRRGRVNA